MPALDKKDNNHNNISCLINLKSMDYKLISRIFSPEMQPPVPFITKYPML